ncbi:hypothetical protein OTB20_19575 [Streptomyces sp. H27-H1]|uniref:hypothetical protein n=1 Tax=Streptomyces sp. H27-H1 TaxID=2996461 RepID=UPI00226D5F34|nr:hypothetical protein [Streptomyces sp. H27-H1]MCY0928358.1 hypothetical protein [Streptomyces sp. H27-H1]
MIIKATRIRSESTIIRLPIETYSDDIDWIAVQRVVSGDLPRPALTPLERKTAALLLMAAGRTGIETAELVGADKRQIWRWRGDAAGKQGRPCTLDGCDKPVKGLGLCSRHYREDAERRNPETAKPPKPAKAACRRGHAYPESLAHRPSGKPYCLPCDQATRKAYRQRERDARNACQDDMRKAA